jgi:uroporphyrinogen decarboxylase
LTDEPTSRFLRACRRLPVDATPVWLMRQAGRYMAEYRALREKHSMLEMLGNADLSAEVTLQPVRAFDLDAAIIFADILPPLVGMGLDLDFIPGQGPLIANPLRTPGEIDRLAAPPAEEHLGPTLEAIRMVSAELAGQGLPLIGFAGAPFTLACYAIEGGSSRDFLRAKRLMLAEPAAWVRLMDKLVTVQADYLLKQAQSGAAALQIFDSWVGIALGADDYRRFVQPFNERLIKAVEPCGVPLIHYSGGTGAYLDLVAGCGGQVLGVDWRIPLDRAWGDIGFERAIQGNLDPAALLAPWGELKAHIDAVLQAAAGRPGHIFNLGHGLNKHSPVDNVRRLIDYVHERTAGRVEAAPDPAGEAV